MKEKPLVSVIMPTFNRADMICRAVDSILNQTYTNIEVVISNDNVPESDASKATLDSLAKYSNDSRVRIVQTAGKTGGGAARNFACRQAKGEYLAFLDDDDEYLPEKIEKELNFILDHGLDMAYQDVSMYKPDGTLVEYRKLDHAEGFSKDELLKAHVIIPLCPTSIYMLKKSLFDKTKGFGETVTAQDWHLMRRCIEADAAIGYMRGSYVKQYLHSGGRISLGNNKIAGENALFAWKKKYFALLSAEEKKFVEFRHYAVLAVSCFRSNMRLDAIKYAVKMFVVSPKLTVSEGISYINRGK